MQRKNQFGDQKTLPCCIFRGGTSKGVLFHSKDLPSERSALSALLLKVMGSPDSRQIDGLGGANPLTSRVGIIKKSKLPGVDIEYQFALVHIDEPIVEFEGFCGNIISAAGPFAINEGLIEAIHPLTSVKIFDTNTKMHVMAEVPVDAGKAQTKGNFNIAGVPQSGACIKLHLYNPAGKITGTLLPTTQVIDSLETSFGTLESSLIDCIDPTVFVRAYDIGLIGDESPNDLLVYDKLEELRSLGAKKMGLPLTPSLPKIVFISPAKTGLAGHLTARMMSLRKMHQAYAVSCAACTAVAAHIPGSIVHQITSKSDKITIHHPLGEMEVLVVTDGTEIKEVTLSRTARCLMVGKVMIPTR